MPKAQHVHELFCIESGNFPELEAERANSHCSESLSAILSPLQKWSGTCFTAYRRGMWGIRAEERCGW